MFFTGQTAVLYSKSVFSDIKSNILNSKSAFSNIKSNIFENNVFFLLGRPAEVHNDMLTSRDVILVCYRCDTNVKSM